MTFSEKMKELRKQLGKSQEQVSKEMGIAISTLRYYENGRLPDTYQLKMIKNYYQVSYEYLLDDNCENKNNENIEISKILKLTDKSIEKIKNLQYFSPFQPNDKEPIPNKVFQKHFNVLLEHLDISSITSEIASLLDMSKIYQYLNLFSSLFYFKEYIFSCIKENKINNLKELLDFYECKLHEANVLIIGTDLDNIMELQNLYDEFYDITEAISAKDLKILESYLYEFNHTAIELEEKAFKQIKYSQYSISEITNRFTYKLISPLDLNNIDTIYKFKGLEKFYQFMSNQKHLGKEFI